MLYWKKKFWWFSKVVLFPSAKSFCVFSLFFTSFFWFFKFFLSTFLFFFLQSYFSILCSSLKSEKILLFMFFLFSFSLSVFLKFSYLFLINFLFGPNLVTEFSNLLFWYWYFDVFLSTYRTSVIVMICKKRKKTWKRSGLFPKIVWRVGSYS